MPRNTDGPAVPALRRTRVLLWIQLALALTAIATSALIAIATSGTTSVISQSPVIAQRIAVPAIAAAAAAVLLAAIGRRRARRWALALALLLLPPLVSAAAAMGLGSAAESGWFAYTSIMSAAVFRAVLIGHAIGDWAAFLAVLASTANALHLFLPASREAFTV